MSFFIKIMNSVTFLLITFLSHNCEDGSEIGSANRQTCRLSKVAPAMFRENGWLISNLGRTCWTKQMFGKLEGVNDRTGYLDELLGVS